MLSCPLLRTSSPALTGARGEHWAERDARGRGSLQERAARLRIRMDGHGDLAKLGAV